MKIFNNIVSNLVVIHATVFVLLVLFITANGCSTNNKKSFRKGDEPSVLQDSLVVVATIDSPFVYVNKGDTLGFLIDFIDRFSENQGVFITYQLCGDFSKALQVFLSDSSQCMFFTQGHQQVVPKKLIFSKHILERNLSLKADVLTNLLLLNHFPLFQSNRIRNHVMFSGIRGDSSSVFKIISLFALKAKDSLQLNRLNSFITSVANRADIAFLKHYYFKTLLPLSMRRYRAPFLQHGRISPYDPCFKEVTKSNGMDWKLLAAIAFKESGFNPTALGAGGAYGIMQFMPFVAAKYGIDGKSTPEQQIRAGCKLVYNTYRNWNKIPSEEQRIKFTLASYNAGQGHVMDAQRLAEKYGLNPMVWDDNVQLMVNNLSLPKYYLDPLVKSGPYHGHAGQYANTVYQIYLSWKAV